MHERLDLKLGLPSYRDNLEGPPDPAPASARTEMSGRAWSPPAAAASRSRRTRGWRSKNVRAPKDGIDALLPPEKV